MDMMMTEIAEQDPWVREIQQPLCVSFQIRVKIAACEFFLRFFLRSVINTRISRSFETICVDSKIVSSTRAVGRFC